MSLAVGWAASMRILIRKKVSEKTEEGKSETNVAHWNPILEF